MTSFVQKKRAKPDLIGLLPTNHFIAYITMAYTGVCEETFDIHSKIADKQRKISLSESRIYKKW